MGKEFYENLKKARLKRGFSQVQIAEKLGVAKSTYSMYESGKREPNIDTIKKLSLLLDVSIDELFGSKKEGFCVADIFSGVGSKADELAKTIAAHFDGTEFTEAELDKIKEFAEFVKSNRK